MNKLKKFFTKFADKASKAVGSPFAFVIAVLILILWGISGPFLKFSDTWQLVINTSTTIITFLTVFLIQNSQNRDSQSIEIKLNELIRATKNANNSYIDIEELSEEDLEKIHKKFENMAASKRKP